jgi:transcription elongation factor GreA
MADNQVKNITELLNEEKWTRATLNSYTIQNFKDLDEVLESIDGVQMEDEVKALCDEHLGHTKNSIIALYLSGIISLSRQLVDDSNLINLIAIFIDNHKWKIVEYLCNRILGFGENRYALRTLAECYEHENEDEKKYEVWKRLIRVDYEEADIVLHLAEQEEKSGNTDQAIDFYKKAIHRFINKKAFGNIRDIWGKFLETIPNDFDFFMSLAKKVAKALTTERAAQLLEDLYDVLKKNENWEWAITVLKLVLEYDDAQDWARTEIVFCYKNLFKGHSQLDEYIRLSNITQGWRNIQDAIADFEKHIAFDEGNFVGHRTWGIGVIRSIKDDMVVIDFTRKRGHEMTLQMAVNALQTLAKDHIWVLKAVVAKEKLKAKVKSDIPWTLKTVIRSFDNAASMKMIKAEIVPSILTQGEWSNWSTEARKILKTDTGFGNHPENVDVYEVRETPISFEEKTFNRFKAENSFFGKISTIDEFLKHGEADSDFFGEMFSYLSNILKAFNKVDETILASFLMIRKITKSFPFLNPGHNLSFTELLTETEELEQTFSAIDNAELKKEFLELARKEDNWEELFTKLFHVALSHFVFDELDQKGDAEAFSKLIMKIIEGYKDYREAFVWLCKNFSEEWFDEKKISYEKILIGLIHLLDISYREIENRRNVSVNRKLNKAISNLLFKEGNLQSFILRTEEDSVTRLFSLVEDVEGLDPSLRIELKQKIVARFPNFHFYGETETESVSRGLLVTMVRYEEKQAELRKLIEVEVPKNAKEIGAAIALGDLSENAEYKAGKERQEMLNIAIGKLKDELERAQILKAEEVNLEKIGFGTKILLENKDSGKDEEYSIMGPWESQPDKNIISYLSPLGTKLQGKKVGDDLEFTINERNYHYVVKSIELVKF